MSLQSVKNIKFHKKIERESAYKYKRTYKDEV